MGRRRDQPRHEPGTPQCRDAYLKGLFQRLHGLRSAICAQGGVDLESSFDMSVGRRGFSLLEAILAVMIVSILTTFALPQLAPAMSRVSVRSAASTFTARHSLAKTLAVRQGSEARLVVDIDASRFWVVVDTSSGGPPVWDTVGAPVDLTENSVAIASTTSIFCFNARGLAKSGSGCPGEGAAISFKRGDYTATLQITALGKVFR